MIFTEVERNRETVFYAMNLPFFIKKRDDSLKNIYHSINASVHCAMSTQITKNLKLLLSKISLISPLF